MNIFYLDSDPYECAKLMVDKHVVKMILETAQLLSTAHRLVDHDYVYTHIPEGKKRYRTEYCFFDNDKEGLLYLVTHKNHPCSLWSRTSTANYLWLYHHLRALCQEYTFRYNKMHKVEASGLLDALGKVPRKLQNLGFTEPPSAMDTKYIISNDPIENYRNYYKYGKTHLHAYTRRWMPEWLKEKNIA